MVPLHFGSSERPLFGIYHPPAGTPRRGGVVICPSLPQEAMRTAWTLRRLATALAERGLHVLRFDWSGTGDSSGALIDVDLSSWRHDLRSAVSELRDLSGCGTISAAGIGLGGALALSTPELALRAVALWDPVVSGAAHLEQLFSLHASVGGRAKHGNRGVVDLLGFAMSPALIADLGALDVLQAKQRRTHFNHVAVLDSEWSSGTRSLCEQLRAKVDPPLPERSRARVADELLISFLAPESVKRVATWLAKEAA